MAQVSTLPVQLEHVLHVAADTRTHLVVQRQYLRAILVPQAMKVPHLAVHLVALSVSMVKATSKLQVMVIHAHHAPMQRAVVVAQLVPVSLGTVEHRLIPRTHVSHAPRVHSNPPLIIMRARMSNRDTAVQ